MSNLDQNHLSPEAVDYDVVVVGAGPAGAEAALAAAAAGAQTLCLSINLDTVGFPPANPVIVENERDARSELLAALEQLGGRLPRLLKVEGVGWRSASGGVRVDRRQLGLHYKELLETEQQLQLRQALVAAIRPAKEKLLLETNFGELFAARAVVLAAGTFLRGKVCDGDQELPGGRMGEIPADSLAICLEDLGIGLTQISASTSPRLSFASLRQTHPEQAEDGVALGEMYAGGLALAGNRLGQLLAIRQQLAEPAAWLTRPSYKVKHLALTAGQVEINLEARSVPGLFFAGRVAGSCNYLEAATLGWLAGREAALKAAGTNGNNLINNYKIVSKLVEAVCRQEQRPLTIRTSETTC